MILKCLYKDDSLVKVSIGPISLNSSSIKRLLQISTTKIKLILLSDRENHKTFQYLNNKDNRKHCKSLQLSSNR